MALLGTKRFWVPYSSDDRKRPSFSLHDLPWIPTGRFKQLLIREGGDTERQGGTVKRNKRAAVGQGAGSPPGTHTRL